MLLAFSLGLSFAGTKASFLCHASTVPVQQVRTPVMNSEAKVLVPGVPGHRAAIKPAPPQTEEVESKRKLGENEVIQSL